jgi:hemerythrin
MEEVAQATQIVWSPDFELGHAAVDQQHRKLFNLADALVRDPNPGQVMAALATLSDYVVVHFRDEEKLMLDIGYPEFETHRKMHEEFRARLAKLYRNAGSIGMSGIAAEVLELVNDWLANHIVTADREYAAYLPR